MVTGWKKRSPRARGTTLVEVLIVVAIIGLIAGAVGVAAYKHWIEAQIKTTETNARSVRQAVEAWRLTHVSPDCPGFDELMTAGTLDKGSTRHDAWGEAWQVECVNGEVTVTSPGPDRQLGTEDDIRAPPT